MPSKPHPSRTNRPADARSVVSRWFVTPVVVILAAVVATAQTPIRVPDNKYTPAQDVELGREAAAEARKQLPIMTDREVTAYLDRIGSRLVAAIPEELRQPAFDYTFQAVNVRDVNAFALPGGPMFVNRGMIQASRTEGEVASVMAHELSHVVLRHGTAQASKATKYQIGQVAGAIVGAIIGGQVGAVVAQGTQFGLGTAFLRFGREYERQADLAGAQIMARAGYDPREMAAMFKTLEGSGASSGPEWLSSHPNPGNRAEAIQKEAASLRVTNAVTGTAAFRQAKAYLESLPRAPTTADAIKNPAQARTTPRRTGGATTARVEAPSETFTEYIEGDIFSVSVPDNWVELASASSVTFAPEGGFFSGDQESGFSHGVQFGVVPNSGRNLRATTDALMASLAESNPGFGRPSAFRNVTVDGQRGLQSTIINAPTGAPRESVRLVTVTLPDGKVLFMVGVAPEAESRSYQGVFDEIVRSIALHD
jgi:Zn-dependent protease with chaperone function